MRCRRNAWSVGFVIRFSLKSSSWIIVSEILYSCSDLKLAKTPAKEVVADRGMLRLISRKSISGAGLPKRHEQIQAMAIMVRTKYRMRPLAESGDTFRRAKKALRAI